MYRFDLEAVLSRKEPPTSSYAAQIALRLHVFSRHQTEIRVLFQARKRKAREATLDFVDFSNISLFFTIGFKFYAPKIAKIPKISIKRIRSDVAV